jgi:hypothetical protein
MYNKKSGANELSGSSMRGEQKTTQAHAPSRSLVF